MKYRKNGQDSWGKFILSKKTVRQYNMTIKSLQRDLDYAKRDKTLAYLHCIYLQEYTLLWVFTAGKWVAVTIIYPCSNLTYNFLITLTAQKFSRLFRLWQLPVGSARGSLAHQRVEKQRASRNMFYCPQIYRNMFYCPQIYRNMFYGPPTTKLSWWFGVSGPAGVGCLGQIVVIACRTSRVRKIVLYISAQYSLQL